LPPSRFELRLGVVESQAISRGFEQLIKCLRNGAADIKAVIATNQPAKEIDDEDRVHSDGPVVAGTERSSVGSEQSGAE
jgi:hypothetical protein